MRFYMVDKMHGECYQEGFLHSQKNFASKNPAEMASNSGAVYRPELSIITLQSLRQSIDVYFPDGKVVFSDSDLSPVWPWRLIILNYLYRADNTAVSNRLISYRELEGGGLFFSTFVRYNIEPLTRAFSNQPPEQIERACLKLANNIERKNCISAVFSFLPRFPVTVQIWPHDEEVGGSTNILFDASANQYLHTEDISAVGDMVSYFLIKEYEQESGTDILQTSGGIRPFWSFD